MNGHGGSRPGAGKPKGAISRKTRIRRAAQARALQQADITAERTMLELARLGFADRRGIVLKPLDQWTPDEGALLEGFEIIKKNAEGGDGHTDTIHKVRLATKHHALGLLAKHFGLVTDKLDVVHRVSLEDLLGQSREPEGP